MPIDDSSKLYEAYLNFKRNLQSGVHPRYEEPDLVEIFDIAGDNADIYVQSEVLMLAARLYPESHELLQRKGLFYSRLSADALHNFLENQPEGEGLSWDILRLRDSGISGSDAVPYIEKLIESHKSLSDEDIIRLCELIRETGCTQWLIDNYHSILSRAGYPETILYEVAATAHESGNDKTAIEILEQLTDIDAFHTENWLLLAECHQTSGNPEEGLKAIEYARAVADNDPEVDFVEASLLIDLQRNLPRACELLRHYIEIHPESLPATHNLIIALGMLGKNQEAKNILYQNLFSTQPEIDPADPYLVETLSNSLKNGFPLEIITLCHLNPALLLDTRITTYYLWALLFQANYQEIAAFFDAPNGREAAAASTSTATLFAMALLKTYRREEASALASQTISALLADSTLNLDQCLQNLGTLTLLTSIEHLATSATNETIASFNPFAMLRN